MAPEMQFVPTMTSAMTTILSLILMASFTTGLFAWAEEESACVKSFRKANTEFFKSHADIKSRNVNAKVTAGVAGAGGAICAYASRKSVVGMIGCGALGVLAGGGSYGYSEIQASKLQALYDGHRLYQIYFSTLPEATEASEYSAQFVTDLGIDLSTETNITESYILNDMAGMMKWSALCEGEQPRSYDEVVDLMKTRLRAPQ